MKRKTAVVLLVSVVALTLVVMALALFVYPPQRY